MMLFFKYYKLQPFYLTLFFRVSKQRNAYLIDYNITGHHSFLNWCVYFLLIYWSTSCTRIAFNGFVSEERDSTPIKKKYNIKFREYRITRKKIVFMFNIERTLWNKIDIYYVYLKRLEPPRYNWNIVGSINQSETVRNADF